MPTPCANNAPYGHATGGGRIVVDPAARRRSDAGAGAVKTPTDVARYVLDSDGTVQPLEAMSSFGTAPFTIYTADPAGPPPFRQMLADGGWSGVAFSGSPSGRMTRLARQFADQYQVPAYQVVLDRAGKMKAVARGGGNGPAAVMVLDPAHPGEPTLHVLEHRGTRSAAMRSFLRNRVLRSVSFEGPGDSAPTPMLNGGRRDREALSADGRLPEDTVAGQRQDKLRAGTRAGLAAAARVDGAIEPVEKWASIAAAVGMTAAVGATVYAQAHGLPAGYLEHTVSGLVQPAQEVVRVAASFFQDVLLSSVASRAMTSMLFPITTAPDARSARRKFAAAATFALLTAVDPDGLIGSPQVVPAKEILTATGAVGAFASLALGARGAKRAGRVRQARLADASVRYLRASLPTVSDSVRAGIRMLEDHHASTGATWSAQDRSQAEVDLADWARREPFKAKYPEFVAAQLGLPVPAPAPPSTAMTRSKPATFRDRLLRDRSGGQVATAPGPAPRRARRLALAT